MVIVPPLPMKMLHLKRRIVLTLLVMHGLQVITPCVGETNIFARKNAFNHDVHSLKSLTYNRMPISILTVFSSVNVNINSLDGNKFQLIMGDRSVIKDEPLWQKGLSQIFPKDRGAVINRKISPFENIQFHIEFADSEVHQIHVKVHHQVIDSTNIGLFIVGTVLFNMAKSMSRSTMFHYTSGASFGIMMSFMVILVLLYKLLPYKRVIAASMATGFSIALYFMEFVWNKLLQWILAYPYHAALFCSLSGLTSVAFMYYFGPPKHERTFNLIQWFLQLLATYLIYQSSYYKEFAITVIVMLVLFQFVSFTKVLMYIFPRRFAALWLTARSPRRLLTQAEYELEGIVETEKALKELSKYCSSPKCNSWDVVSKLKTPKRFAEFLKSNKQFTVDELEAYEYQDFSTDGELKIDDEEQPSQSRRSPCSSISSLSNGHVHISPNSKSWLSDDNTLELLTD